MDSISRVLPAKPYETLADYIADGVGNGLTDTRLVETSVVLDEDAAVVGATYSEKQMDWTYGREATGRARVDRLTDHRGLGTV